MQAAPYIPDPEYLRITRRFIAGHRHDYAARKAGAMPASLEAHLLAGWDARTSTHPLKNPVRDANRWLNETTADLTASRYRAAYDEAAIRDHAENYSTLCSRMASLERRRLFGLHFGVEPPKGRSITAAGEIARWDDPMWWRRQLRKVWTRESENAMRALGIIRKGKQHYASDEAIEHRAARQRRTVEWLKDRVMVATATGETLELFDLHKTSLANPGLRNKEFMTRSRGFTEIAKDMGHGGIAATLTTPSKYHAQLSAGGANPNWEAERARVRDGQDWLCRMWARVRAKLKRLSIMVYGFRCAEPHHDATPHWHMSLYMEPHHVATVKLVLRGYWLSEYGDEPGAQERRVVLKDLDPAKGGMAAYMAKYFAKHLDPGSMADDEDHETGTAVDESTQRAVAWASCHGIRQFQQIGGPPVGLWRELRRLRNPVEADHIEAARLCADGADWSGFIRRLGGIERASRRVVCNIERYRRTVTRAPAKRDEWPLVWMDRAEGRAVDREGREVLAITRYGEMPAMRAAGVCAFGLLGRYQAANTRPHRWRIEIKSRCVDTRRTDAVNAGAGAGSFSESVSRSGSALGPVAITVRGSEVDASAGQDWSWVMTVPYRGRAGPH